MEKLSWDQILTLITQKGANGAIILVSIKLIYGADLTTEIGAIITCIGASLLAIAATLEYLTWRTRVNVMAIAVKDLQKLGKEGLAALVAMASGNPGQSKQ